MNDPLLDDFLSTKNPQTQRVYHTILQHYMNYTGKSMTELVEEAEEEQYGNVLKRKRKIKGYLSGFKQYREDLGHSPHTVKNSITTVRSFYNYFDVDLPKEKQKYHWMERLTADRLPTRSDIRRVLSVANPKYRSIISVGYSSGMGAGEITSLTIQDLINGLGINNPHSIGELRHIVDEYKAPVIKWKIHRIKTGSPYVTFSNPETLHNILEYLGFENPYLEDGPLFPGDAGKPLRGKSLATQYQRLNDRCGFGRVGRQGYFRSHTMRKWFAVQMERTALGYNGTRQLLGHSVPVDPVGDSYILTDPNHLEFLYRQSMAAVSVTSRVKTYRVTDERVERLEAKMDRMEKALELSERLRQHPRPE
jgi:integrase